VVQHYCLLQGRSCQLKNVIQAAYVPGLLKSTLLIGVDLGSSISIRGSLATILWLVVLRRAGQTFLSETWCIDHDSSAFVRLRDIIDIDELM
jgi:hypothetical protein